MNPLAKELNSIIESHSPEILSMLSDLGKEMYFPKGILTQTAEAKKKAHRFNATVGIAKHDGQAMNLKSVCSQVAGHSPNDYLTYAPSPGLPPLRETWLEHMKKKNPTLNDRTTSLPVVTCGVTHGLSTTANLFVNPGDTVLIPDMMWGNYNMVFKVKHNSNMIAYPVFSDKGGFDVDRFAKVVTENADKGKLVVAINSPNNPTGYALTENEVERVSEILVKTAEEGCRIVVVLDDAYFGLFYEENVCRESMFARLADQHERLLAVKLDGATKEDFVWGLRVGFITFSIRDASPEVYSALEKKTGGDIRGTISNCSHLSQTMVLTAMQSGTYDAEKRENFEILKSRAMKVKEVLKDSRFDSAWTPYPFNSGYFMCLRMKSVEAEPFRVRLLDEHGIGVIASGKHNIRIAFSCTEEEDIPELFDTMYECACAMSK